ncbi:Uncharacterized protein OBRU01_12638 [Operophtera brumata]|uniref:Uncharacterized protein n=1 Tax=Operophtera brumata TaxID=104452 RepID=A0A0L7KZ43_OPEBR|nr:Uncharacterized protein OBRU01_12638 [Operophtera brumata]
MSTHKVSMLENKTHMSGIRTNNEYVIEIVEEQRCHNTEFRLTCRDLDSHIAVLEAWYTALDEYQPPNTTHSLKLKTENDSELNRVYVYSSPKHNGVYEPTNHSFFENSTAYNFNDTFLNGSFWLVNDTVDSVIGESEVLGGQCGGDEFTRSYASWREGDRRRQAMSWNSSVNLRAPLSYR